MEIVEKGERDDAISRQSVINAIENDCMRGGLGSCFASYDDAQKFRGEIEQLPSVTRQTGKWIINGIEYSEAYSYKLNCSCSVCGYETVFYDTESTTKPCLAKANYVHKYCPNCGTRMENIE